jgi:hypothetical protein
MSCCRYSTAIPFPRPLGKEAWLDIRGELGAEARPDSHASAETRDRHSESLFEALFQPHAISQGHADGDEPTARGYLRSSSQILHEELVKRIDAPGIVRRC